MKYEYSITNENGKYYRSRHEYVSSDFVWTDHEIDATFMEESDLLYLLNESECHFTNYCHIHIAFKGLYIGNMTIGDFNSAIKGEYL